MADREPSGSLEQILGAEADTSSQMLSVYIPNKDKDGKEIGNQRKWVIEAADLLAHMGGGVSIMPPIEGGWKNDEGKIIWELPVIVYTFIRPMPFAQLLPRLRLFLHDMGRETNQGEVAIEFDGRFYRIRKFDQR